MTSFSLADVDAGATLRGLGRPDGWPVDLGVILLTVGALLLANLFVYFAWRWFRRDGLERAFLVSAARGRLPKRSRNAVRTAAAMIGAPPVALVISEHAFSEGQRAVAASGANEATIAALSQARQRLFA